MTKLPPLNPPYSLGYIEDVPGEKFWVIGADGILFARIPQVDERQAETICAMLNAANQFHRDSAELAELRRDAERLDWLAAHSSVRVMGGDERGWRAYDQSSGLSILCERQPTFRAAVDAAMQAAPLPAPEEQRE